MELEKIEYKGYTITAFQDDFCESPNDWYDEDEFIVYDHRDFEVVRDGFDPQEIYDAMENAEEPIYKGYFVFPLYACIHSGVSLSLSRSRYPHTCPWDTSFRGFVLVKRNDSTDEQTIAERLVKLWNDYLSGEVYGYHSEIGVGDSYWGEEGYKEMIEDAKQEIDERIKIIQDNHFRMLKGLIKTHVPLMYRPSLEDTLIQARGC